MTQPPDTAAPDANEIAAQLAAVTDYVRGCEMRVLKGEMMDLGGLDRTVIDLCQNITRLPPKDARALEPRMLQLIEGLDALAGNIKEQQAALAGTGGKP